ncbi:putative porin [Pseudoalteromonas sp. SSMSWG5]|uniref:putative porin n=1 Tax=Pseudoalteromonas TaxID=53246 RepID=UPI001093422D|nr:MULTISPECIES: putative porin [unclassified Pseudoalteromonas]MCO7249905.1 putative porin [Pseudoalteromonas sp. Ps84H-4]TGV21109.1 putative porin [Pseudoalteromonas sp. MEBiC 03607]
MFKQLAPIALATLAYSSYSTAATEQQVSKQWFNSINYTHVEHDRYSFNGYQLASHYYFEEQQSSGVLDDYGYLDTDSNILVNYSGGDYYNDIGIFGEYFLNNWFAVADIRDVRDLDNYTLGIGYLFADALKVSVNRDVREYGDDYFRLKAQYNLQINDKDYLGFSAETDDELDVWNLSARYFNHLSGSHYITVDVGHQDSVNDSASNAMISYYFGEHYAIGAGLDDSELVLQGKYFINDKYYLTANYTESGSAELYNLKFVAQF